MQLLPLDVSCTNKDNIMTEQSSVMTANNNLRVIIPRHNPFFTKGFELRHPNSHEPLVLGKDYRFIYKYVDIEEVATDVLHGGIQIINPKLDGSFSYKYHPIGGQYCLPTMVLIDYLVNTLIDPVEVRWQNIIDRITRYAAEEHTQDWHDFRNSEDIALSIDGVAEALVNKSDAMDNAFDSLEQHLAAAKKRLDDSRFNEHIANHQSPHRLTPTQVNGLDKDAAVQNALKVYGKTVLELAKYISDNELNQSHLDTLLPMLGGTLTRRLIMSSDGLLIRNSTGTSKLSLKDNALTLELENSLLMRADNDASSHDETLTLQAGENQLVIKSDESGIQVSSLTYNGSPILTDKTVRDHTGSIDIGNAITVTTRDSETLDFVGTGRKNDPLKINLKLKEASKNTYGITQISTVLDNSESKPIAAKHAKAAAERIRNALEHTVKVNNKVFNRGDITITVAELGIDRLDNTAPANKPISNAQSTALRDKADVGHKHENLQNTLIVDADDSVDGMVRLSNEYIKDVSANKGKGWAVTPLSLKYLKEDIADTLAKSKRLVPVLDITVYGTMDYLPLPASGAYAAAGDSTYNFTIEREKNGRFTMLRSGIDRFSAGIFYLYFELDRNQQVINLQSTSTKYILPDQSIDLVRIQNGCQGLFVAIDSNNQRYIVLTNNTLDSNEHIYCKLDSNVLDGDDIELFLIGNTLYIFYMMCDTANIRCNLRTLDVSKIRIGATIAASDIVYKQLNGVDFFGDPVVDPALDNYIFCEHTYTHEPDVKALFKYPKDFSYSKDIRHAGLNRVICLSDDKKKIRVCVMSGNYHAKASGAFSILYCYSYTVDLITGRVTTDMLPTDFITVNEGPSYHGQLRCKRDLPWVWPNQSSIYRNVSGYIFARYHKYSQMLKFENPFDDIAVRSQNTYTNSQTAYVKGRYGSILERGFRVIHNCHDNFIMSFSDDNGKWVKSEYDVSKSYPNQNGFGPTTNRVEMSNHEATYHFRTPFYWDGTHSKMEGCIFKGVNWEAYTRIDSAGMHDKFKFTDSSLSDKLKEKIQPLLASDTSLSLNQLVYTVYIFGNGIGFVGAGYDFKIAGATNRKSYYAGWRCTYTKSGGEVKNIVLGEEYQEPVLCSSSSTGVSSTENNSPGSVCYKLEDGNYAYVLNNVAYNGYIGWSQIFASIVVTDPAGKVLYHVRAFTKPQRGDYKANGFLAFPELGGVGNVYDNVDGSQTLIFNNSHGNTLDSIKNAAGDKVDYILLATAMPTGWVLYFTAEIPIMVNGRIYQMPETNFDVYQLFGERVKNKLIRIYIKTDDATPTYHLSLDDLSNDARYVYIGFCRTNNDRLYEIKITGVTIMSEFVELTDHILTPRAHGLNDLLQSIGKDKIVNADMVVSESDVVAGVPQYATKDYIYNLIKESDIGRGGKLQAVKELRHNFTANPSHAPIPFPAGWNPSNTLVIIDDVRIGSGHQGNYTNADLFSNGYMRDWSIHIKERGGKYYLVGERFYHTTNREHFPTSGHTYSTRILLVRKK